MFALRLASKTHRLHRRGDTRLKDLTYDSLIARNKHSLAVSVGAVCALHATNAADVPFAGGLTICVPFLTLSHD